MLTDLTLLPQHSPFHTPILRVSEGFYITDLNHFLDTYYDYNTLPTEENLPAPYGVCDTPQQFFTKYGEQLNNHPSRIFVTFTPIWKENEPETGGWRWSKWGPYCGTQTTTHEYLYDEPDINMVCVYHVYSQPADEQ